MLIVTQLDRSFIEKALGDMVDMKLSMSQQRAFATRKAHGVLGCFRQNIAGRLRKVVLLSPYLEMHFWARGTRDEWKYLRDIS